METKILMGITYQLHIMVLLMLAQFSKELKLVYNKDNSYLNLLIHLYNNPMLLWD